MVQKWGSLRCFSENESDEDLPVNFDFVEYLENVFSVWVRWFLTESEVAKTAQMMADGTSQRQVAGRLGGSHSVVARLWNRY